jgi:hypothetical protein
MYTRVSRCECWDSAEGWFRLVTGLGSVDSLPAHYT